MADSKTTATAAAPGMLTVQEVAAHLQCSPRTVYRLIETQSIPAPVRVGSFVRWPGALIERWIARGCPAIQDPAS